MNAKRILVIAIALLFTTVSCSLLSIIPIPTTPTAEIPSTGGTPVATSLPGQVYVPPECAGKPIATLPAATTEALPTPSLAPNPTLTKDQQLSLLDQISAPIPSLYVYPDLNGLNWTNTVAKYRAKIEAGLTTDAFYSEMQNMIGELGDNHSFYESPAEVAASSAQLAGKNDYVGIGVEITPEINRSDISVVLVFPGSAAEHAGLQPHDDLVSVDGIPLVKNGAPLTQLVRGPACSVAVLTVQTPGEPSRQVMVMRYEVKSAQPIVARLVTTTDGSRIGYIFLPSFFDETIPAQVAQVLQQWGNLDGLILDNRLNGGGSSDVVDPILSYFTDGLLGHFVSRTASREVSVSANPINNSQTVPMVVLVGDGTASFGEIFSGIMKDMGRAKIVGKTTQGKVEILDSHQFSDGSVLWLAQERFVELHSTADWKKTGIFADVTAFADWGSFTFDNDPSIAAALQLLGHK